MTCHRSYRAAAAAQPLPFNPFRARPRPLVLAMHLAFAGSLVAGAGWSTEVQAQATHATAPAARSYDIPAGPLSDVLTRFSTEAGIFLVGSTELAQGKNSRGVRGTYSLQAALDTLLAGTGLEMQRNAQGRYVLRVADSMNKSVPTLPVVNVTAQFEKDGTTEGTGSYQARYTNTATKLNLSPRETPQTLTVVTRQKMDDFGLTNIDAVIENGSTIISEHSGHNGNIYYSRGFMLQNQYDGMPNPIGIGENNLGPKVDTAFLDKVEILQGASGLMAGAGQPGGTINLVRKRPTEDFQANVETQLGSWNKKRLVGDISGSLTESRKVRGRAVALVDHSDSFTDYVFYKNKGFYGIVEADITSTTTLGASVMYQKTDFNDQYGVPFAPNGSDLKLPRSSFFGTANGGSTRDSTSSSLSLEQKLPSSWALKAAFTHTDASVDKVASDLRGTLNTASGNGLSLSAGRTQREFSSNVLDLHVSGPFQLFGRKHELVFGGTGIRMNDKTRNWGRASTAVNVYTYDGEAIPRPSGTIPAYPVANETNQHGMYGVVRLNLADPLKLILGTRVSWYEHKAAGMLKQKESAVVSPYAGVLYDINSNYTAYVSYSDIFTPQSNLMASGGTVEPVVGKNYEAGIKGEFMNGRLNASAAVFRLEQTNLAQVDSSVGATACNGGACYTAAGLVVSEGIDLSLNGEVGPGWQVGAGYTYVNSDYGNGKNKGDPYSTYLPKQILQLHTTYRIPETGWTVGGNIRISSKAYMESSNFRVQQGGYAIAGLLAKYQISKDAELSLAINNLFDRHYYFVAHYPSTNLGYFYGTPRSFSANFRYNF